MRRTTRLQHIPQPHAPGVRLLAGLLLAALPGVVLALDPGALPEGGQVVAGDARVRTEGRTMTVSQASQRAILHWQRFDIGADAAVHFQQPSASAVALNRVVGGDASRVAGQLRANGQVYLVNSAGVLFGRGAQVDVGRLVTSTRDIATADFLAGRDRFAPDEALGALASPEAAPQGTGARQLQQAPTATAQPGSEAPAQPDGTPPAVAAPRQLTMDAGADGHLRYGLPPGQMDTLMADGGLVDDGDGDGLMLTSQGASALASSVVAHDGAPQARTVALRDGRILLLAADAGQPADPHAAAVHRPRHPQTSVALPD